MSGRGFYGLNHRHLGGDGRMKQQLFISSHFLTKGKKKIPHLFYLNIAEQYFEYGRRQNRIRQMLLQQAKGNPAASQGWDGLRYGLQP